MEGWRVEAPNLHTPHATHTRIPAPSVYGERCRRDASCPTSVVSLLFYYYSTLAARGSAGFTATR